MIGHIFLDTHSKSPGMFYRGNSWTMQVDCGLAYKWYISPINLRRSFNNIMLGIL